MKLIHLVVLFMLMDFSAEAQRKYDPVKVGDTVPDIIFRHMLNYSSDSAKLSDFRGKLLILDFWNVNCAPCVGGFPKMEQLQKQFGNKIQILLVNGINPLEKLGGRNFPSKHPNSIIRATKLPFVFQSKTQAENELYNYGKENLGVLTSLFRHSFEPHHVWIDEQGVVVALTTAANTTAENIQAHLDGKKLALTTVNYITDFRYEMNGSFLRSPNDLVMSKLQYSSAITRNLFTKAGFGGGWIIEDTATGIISGLRCINEPPIRLFMIAYGFTEQGQTQDKVILEVENTADFVFPLSLNSSAKAEWEVNNLYCYETILPPGRVTTSNEQNIAAIESIMRKELENYFGVVGSISRRRLNCLVLKRTNQQLNFRSMRGVKERVIERNESGLKLKNAPFYSVSHHLSNYINSIRPGTPVIDETGLSEEKVDIDIRANLTDLEAVRRELSRYGVGIFQENREFEVLVLKQIENLSNNGGNTPVTKIKR